MKDLLARLFGRRRKSDDDYDRLAAAIRANEAASGRANRAVLKHMLDDSEIALELREVRKEEQRDSISALLDDTLSGFNREKRG